MLLGAGAIAASVRRPSAVYTRESMRCATQAGADVATRFPSTAPCRRCGRPQRTREHRAEAARGEIRRTREISSRRLTNWVQLRGDAYAQIDATSLDLRAHPHNRRPNLVGCNSGWALALRFVIKVAPHSRSGRRTQ